MNYKSLFKIIIAIADVHIGNRNVDPDEYKYQLKNGIINKLQTMTFIDGIVLCGDTLHEALTLNGEYANVFFWFINKLVKIAREKNSFIRIIKGTKSHDGDQLDNLEHYETDEVDFRIIRTREIETIDGHIYGYIPEEYISNPDEYYQDFYNKPDNYFDFIFGHGLIEECKFMEQESENHNTKAPAFHTTKLFRVCKGPISFGHIHTPMNIRNKFFYVGSSLRTCHGEEHDKGYNIITYIQNEGLYRVDKVINEFTFNFNTLNINSSFVENHTIDEIVEYVENFKKTNKTDKLSLKIKCIDYKETVAKIHVLKKYFLKDKSISSKFKIMSRKAYEKEIEIDTKKEEKSYCKPGLTIVERIKLWSLEKRGTRLDESDIAKFLEDDRLKRKVSE